MRTRFPVIAGTSAPVVCTLIDEDSASGTDPLSLAQANSFTARARSADGATVEDLTITLASPSAGTVSIDPTPLTAGEWVVQVGFTDTAGKLHTYPSDGDGFRLVVKERV